MFFHINSLVEIFNSFIINTISMTYLRYKSKMVATRMRKVVNDDEGFQNDTTITLKRI